MKLTQRTVDAIRPVDKLKVFFDDEVKGFGLRISPPSSKAPTGARSYIFEYRPHGSGKYTPKRRFRLGSVDELTATQARAKAELARADVRKGADPATDLARKRAEMTFGELWELYRADHKGIWKMGTAANYEALGRVHILDRLGRHKLSEISSEMVKAMHREITRSRGRYVANRAVGAVRSFWNWRAANDGTFELRNPAANVKLNKEEPRQLYLSPAEMRRLFAVLAEAETEGLPWRERTAWKKHTPSAENRRTRISSTTAAAIRLLAFTGARMREILNLQWDEVDFERRILWLKDSKTGRKNIALSGASTAVLQKLHDALPTDPKQAGYPHPDAFVFAEVAGGAARTDLHRPWRALVRAAGLPAGSKIHTIRHSVASLVVNSGQGLEAVGALLGHRSAATSARYAHIADATQRRAAESVSAAIFDITPVQVALPALVDEDLIG